VDKDFIDQLESDELLRNVPASYADILIACQFFRCFKRGSAGSSLLWSN
jgi:hypothetical protein